VTEALEYIPDPPEGLILDCAKHFYRTSPLPSQPYAIASSLTMVSGVMGRDFQINGTGTNQYVLVVGPSASGKDVMNDGPQKLLGAINVIMNNDHANEFRGPPFASGQGALRHLAFRTEKKLSLSFAVPWREAGYKFEHLAKENTSEANSSHLAFILDAYMASGDNRKVEGIAYSEQQKTIGTIDRFGLTIGAEATPSSLWPNLNKRLITNGLLPRFVIFEQRQLGERAEGELPTQPPEELINRLASLIAMVRKHQQAGTVCNIRISAEANALLNAFGNECHELRRNVDDDVTSECYGRSHLKALRLAGLAAGAANFEDPIVDVVMARWGIAQSRRDVATLLDAAHGKLGVAQSETDHDKQAAYVLKKIIHWTTCRFEDLPKGYSAALHAAKWVPYRYLSHQCQPTAAFQKDKDSTRALKRAIQNLVDEERIVRAEAKDLTFFNTRQECVMLKDIAAI